MRRALPGLVLFPFLLCAYAMALAMRPRHHIVRSAALAGLAVGRIVAGAAW